MNPRGYQSSADLEKMLALLQAGRAAANGTYYVHVGDLQWWLFYPPLDHSHWENIYLWDDPADPQRILGWALLTPGEALFDVYLQPALRGTPSAWQMYAWAEAQAAETAHAANQPPGVMWVSEKDDLLHAWLAARGYRRLHASASLSRSLDEPIPAPVLPDGFTLRPCAGAKEVLARAVAQYGAFESSAPFDAYQQRWLNFMRSPAYAQAMDIVAVSPDERIGAFGIAWPDSINRVGNFEPVGTHPDFQRKGLGKAVMLAALHRLQAMGMTSAIVCTGESNTPAIRLYESTGFRVAGRLWQYERTTAGE